jgi:hypothetical protein
MRLLLAQILTHTQTHTHTRTHIHTHAHTHVLQTRLCLLAIKAPFNHNRVTGYIGVGLAKTVYIYGLYTVVLAEKAPNIRSYTVFIYGSGQPYIGGNAQQTMREEKALALDQSISPFYIYIYGQSKDSYFILCKFWSLSFMAPMLNPHFKNTLFFGSVSPLWHFPF